MKVLNFELNTPESVYTAFLFLTPALSYTTHLIWITYIPEYESFGVLKLNLIFIKGSILTYFAYKRSFPENTIILNTFLWVVFSTFIIFLIELNFNTMS